MDCVKLPLSLQGKARHSAGLASCGNPGTGHPFWHKDFQPTPEIQNTLIHSRISRCDRERNNDYLCIKDGNYYYLEKNHHKDRKKI